jgi:hypothetical protein
MMLTAAIVTRERIVLVFIAAPFLTVLTGVGAASDRV